jgi:TM2 domain-containing membrane protein YozV
VTHSAQRRTKVLALLLSGVFPGLGQFYNREPGKAIAFVLVGALLSWFVGRALPTDPEALLATGRAVFLPLGALLAVWVWSLVDAWRAADR